MSARFVDKLPLFAAHSSPMSIAGDLDRSGLLHHSHPHPSPVLPPPPLPLPQPHQLHLSFSDLAYSVKRRRLPRKTLLHSVSGEALDGEILAVLGASGSGKSTLIDALANRISRSSLLGSVTLNGDPISGHLFRSISAYVMQDDLLYPMLTVSETMLFAADFRLPRSLTSDRKRARVDALIDQLGLRSAADTIVGDESHRGISGGERRRLSIGIDIIHDPVLLFLDEPTSGLDSTSAFMVVNVLKRIAMSGSVVVMSVHQPSSRIVALLDRLLLLSGGRTVFYGPPDSLQSYFSDFGSPIPADENPVEFALDFVRELEMTPAGTAALVAFNASRRHPKTHQKPSMSLKDAVAASVSRGKLVSGTGTGATAVPKYANPFWVEAGVLAKRAFLNNMRMPELIVLRLVAILMTGFCLATIFWRLPISPSGAQERLGFFTIAMSTMFYLCAEALPVFLQDRYIFIRETAHNAYRRSSYVVANAVVALPTLVLFSFAFAITIYFAVGLAGGSSGFFFFVAIMLASFWAGSGFVTFLSSVLTKVMLAYPVVITALSNFLLMSGFFINRNRLPKYWLWYHYMSPVKYPYEAVMLNEFSPGANGRSCFVRGGQMFDGTPLGGLPEIYKTKVLQAMGETLGANLTATTCITTGADILRQQAVTQMDKWTCLAVAVAWGFLFRLLFYVALLLGSKNKRK